MSGSKTARWACSNGPGTRGAGKLNTLELNGERASLYFDLEDSHRLPCFDHGDPDHLHGWRSIHVTGNEHPYMKHWWVPGCTIGYEHTFINALADFLSELETETPTSPTFRDALATHQQVLDAVLESAEERHWVELAAWTWRWAGFFPHSRSSREDRRSLKTSKSTGLIR